VRNKIECLLTFYANRLVTETEQNLLREFDDKLVADRAVSAQHNLIATNSRNGADSII